jgi:hypothetical protein
MVEPPVVVGSFPLSWQEQRHHEGGGQCTALKRGRVGEGNRKKDARLPVKPVDSSTTPLVKKYREGSPPSIKLFAEHTIGDVS